MADPAPTPPVSNAGETVAHRALKRLALAWAAQHRLALCGAEVRLPRSGYRADVAAATPRVTAPNAFTAVFECKASRADFRRDAADEAETRKHLADLRARVTALREAIAVHRPDLRRSDELFPEFCSFDLRDLRHTTHDRLTREVRAAETRLWDGTKFSKLARWRAASLLYLVAEPGIVARDEVPDGWGLLEREAETLVLRVTPCGLPTTVDERLRLVERIAASAGADARRRYGVAWPHRRDEPL